MNREIETRDKIFSTTNSLQQLLGPCQDLTRNSCARGFAVLVFGNHIFRVAYVFSVHYQRTIIVGLERPQYGIYPRAIFESFL